MEWCGLLYKGNVSEGAVKGMIRVIVLLLLLRTVAAVCTDSMPGTDMRISGSVPAAKCVLCQAGAGMQEAADPARMDLARMCAALPHNGEEGVLPEEISVKPAAVPAEDTAVKPKTVPKADAAKPEACEAGGASGQESALHESAQTAVNDQMTPEVSADDLSDAADGDAQEESSGPADMLPENPPADVSGTVRGFLVNESGVIYGISDPGLIAEDGYMELPSEGCSGIAAGTFSAGFPGIREIFIPSNITYIEEGAFAGLPDMEWYEMVPSGEYYTQEGVLFSENGSCLLAFPAGRTGIYKVPASVVRFAAGSFDGAQIEAADATACELADTSGIPEGIGLLLRAAS